MLYPRRQFISKLPAGVIFSSGLSSQLFAQDKSRAPRADEVLWGGMGFSVPNADIRKMFPMTSKALDTVGGPSKLAMGLVAQLEKQYSGGVIGDPTKQIKVEDDPWLLFTVSLDFEQMIIVRGESSIYDFQTSYVYALAQVLYLELPRDGGTDGDLRVLYSFPFRVFSQAAVKSGIEQDKIAEFKATLFDFENSLINTFTKKVVSKKFRNGDRDRVKRLRVMSVTFTPEAAAAIKDLNISDWLNGQFFGQAISASLADRADMSVLPYGQNDSLNRALSQRFTLFPNISNIFEKTLNDGHTFAINLMVNRVLRQSVGSSIGNILYRRGISFLIKVTNVDRKTVVFDKKILLIEDAELAKLMFDRLKDYDLKYMVQMTIKLFDVFAEAVISESPEKIKAIGLDPRVDANDFKALKEVFIACRY